MLPRAGMVVTTGLYRPPSQNIKCGCRSASPQLAAFATAAFSRGQIRSQRPASGQTPLSSHRAAIAARGPFIGGNLPKKQGQNSPAFRLTTALARQKLELHKRGFAGATNTGKAESKTHLSER